MNNYLMLINEWYRSKCDGDWEHAYGFKLDNIDNPGWSLKIDGENSKKIIDTEHEMDEEESWVTIVANEHSFEGFCGVLGFEEMLKQSLIWLEIEYYLNN